VNSASTVLRGAGAQLIYGRDAVAPSGNQAANGEHKHRPVASGGPSLLDRRVCNFGDSRLANVLQDNEN